MRRPSHFLFFFVFPFLPLVFSACLPSPSPTPTSLPIPSATLPPSVTPPQRFPSETPLGLPTIAPSETPLPVPTDTATPLPPGVIPTAPPLSIKSFLADPARIQPGESITLTWEAQAQSLVIFRLDANRKVADTYFISGPPPLVVSTASDWRGQVNFVLVASSGSSTAQAFVSVPIECASNDWFFENPPGVCPAGSAIIGLAANERFEHGRMIWLSWTKRIYVLYNDSLGPKWELRTDNWQEGMPDVITPETPPAGLYQPVRGFDIVWEDIGALIRARDRLGWARAPESGYAASFQCDTSSSPTCYLRGPAGEVFVLLPGQSGWFVWAGPTPVPTESPTPTP